MRAKFLCLFVFAIVTPIAAYADPVDLFTLEKPFDGTGTFSVATFSLPASPTPDLVMPESSPGGFDGWFEIFNVPVTNRIGNSTFTDFETVEFTEADGSVDTNYFSINSETELFTGGLSHPTFVLGTFNDPDRADGRFVRITSAVPEPSTFVMMSTALLGLVGLTRNKITAACRKAP